MSNMSYCQFENTLSDLRDCEEWLNEHQPDELSDTELKAFRRLVARCKRIAENYED